MIEAPEDGKVSWTAHADLAEAAALILAGEWRYEGPTPPLTGAEALSLADLAGIASKIRGRHIDRVMISEDAFKTKMTMQGAPKQATRIALGLYAASRAGEFAAVDRTLERLLGRRPTSMRGLISRTEETG